MTRSHVLADRPHLWAFAAGCLAVTAGVLMHLPMFWMGRDNGFHLADMRMDAEMIWGMGLIVIGIAVAGYGLLPRQRSAGAVAAQRLVVSAPEDAPLLWFMNLPTGLLLVFLSVFAPESPKFVLAMRRHDEAHDTLRSFGCVVHEEGGVPASTPAFERNDDFDIAHGMAARTWALSITALSWGLINFGLLLWMPAHLIEKGAA